MTSFQASGSSGKIKFLSIVLLSMGLLSLAGLIGIYFITQPVKPGSENRTVIEVPKNTRPKEIAERLEKMKVIHSASVFLWVGRVFGQWRKLKAGEYEVSEGMSALEILRAVTSGISLARSVTVKEGDNIYHVAEQFEKQNLATAKEVIQFCKNRENLKAFGFNGAEIPSLEGYLFPETYFFNRTMTLAEMIGQMVKKFQSVWNSIPAEKKMRWNWTQHQVVTLASIIEKETGAAQERPKISSVFHNRLKKGMRLQSDPTSVYGVWDRFDGDIRKKDLRDPNPFNTYYVKALPIGPIANPGKEAILAVFSPEQTDYLFFVSKNDGTHVFTKEYKDHLSAVQFYQLDPSMREGKSWRDLNKKH